jgi:hypothetical protein
MANAILFKVEYVTETFDLTKPRSAFEFIFQMYNYFSMAVNDNRHLRQPRRQLARVKEMVNGRNYPTFTSAQGGEEDSFDKPSVQKEVTSAGYTITQPISEEITLLIPVSRNSPRCTRYLV